MPGAFRSFILRLVSAAVFSEERPMIMCDGDDYAMGFALVGWVGLHRAEWQGRSQKVHIASRGGNSMHFR